MPYACATTNTKSFSYFTLNYFALVDVIMPKVKQCNMLHSGKKTYDFYMLFSKP